MYNGNGPVFIVFIKLIYRYYKINFKMYIYIYTDVTDDGRVVLDFRWHGGEG